ncbi:MAG: hypothetical protein HY815_04655 [Candidatus Riflebacteria bacterium]|nr:hypothetical protein [Candidatus Riflebacteria bacterium]
MKFDRFCELVKRESRRVPSALFAGLDGGVHCERKVRRDPESREIFILGYYEPASPLGPRIVLHHGSFEKMRFGTVTEYGREIRITLRHELRHHWEDRAGLPDLREEDARWLASHRPRHEGRRASRLAVAAAWVAGLFAVVVLGLLPIICLVEHPLLGIGCGILTGLLAAWVILPERAAPRSRDGRRGRRGSGRSRD